MARLRIIILDQDDARTFRYALWADVPAARQPFYARAGAVSAWSGATAADNAALAAGSVVERVDKMVVPTGTTIPQAQAQLQVNWQSFQALITATNLWARYGTTWDGTTWVAQGVA